MLSDFRKFSQETKGRIRNHVQGDAGYIARAGLVEMRTTIEKTESALAPGKEGRWMTGRMYNALEIQVKQSGNATTAVSGWLTDKQRYFIIQDVGGTGYGAFDGQEVWGMFAVQAAHYAQQGEAAHRGYEIL